MLGCRVEELTLKVMVDVLKYVDKAYVGESRGESTTADTREKKRKEKKAYSRTLWKGESVLQMWKNRPLEQGLSVEENERSCGDGGGAIQL